MRPAIRSTLVLSTCAALALAAGPPAAPGSSPVERGMPPEPVEEGVVVLPDVFCGFPIEAAFVGAEGFMALPRFDLLTAPGLRVTLTNPDTDASVQYTISGTFRDVYNDDGSVTTHAAGTNLLVGLDPVDEELFLVVTRGKATLTFPDADDFNTFTVDARHVTDVCGVLDPDA